MYFFYAYSLCYRILHTVRLSGTFVVLLMPGNWNEFKNEHYALCTVTINRRTRNCLHRAKLPTLYTRRLQAIAILMYKVKNGLAPPYIADLFAVTNSQYHLRNHDFVIPRFRTVAYGKHSLTYLGPAIWSKLDISIRLSESLGTFKKRIKLVNFTSLLDSTCKGFFFLCKN